MNTCRGQCYDAAVAIAGQKTGEVKFSFKRNAIF